MHTNSGNCETRLKCSQDWSRLGLISALSRLCLSYALASISCKHCRSSRNNLYYCITIVAAKEINPQVEFDSIHKRAHVLRHIYIDSKVEKI